MSNETPPTEHYDSEAAWDADPTLTPAERVGAKKRLAREKAIAHGHGNGAAQRGTGVEDTPQFDQLVNEKITAQEREPDTGPTPYVAPPCPDILWQGRFAQIADRLGKRSWEVWFGSLCALGAVAHKNLHWHYYRPLYGMVYGLLVAPTGQGKGTVADLCRALLPEHYTYRESVQSGPGLFQILANITKDAKGKTLTITPRPAILVIEEWSMLVKSSKIEFSNLQETLNILFHRPYPWNVSRSDTEKSGGDREVANPTLSICTTTTASMLKEIVTPAMIRAGFLNRYFIVPGSPPAWTFHDRTDAGVSVKEVTGYLDDLVARPWGNGENVWTAYAPDAEDRIGQWGDALFNPLMASSSLDAESLKRLHVYSHIISLLYAWSEGEPRVLLRHVEAAIAACEVSYRFVNSLLAEEDVPVPKFKQYEMGLEQKIIEKVRRDPGITTRKICQDLRKSGSCRDINATTQTLIASGAISSKQIGKKDALFNPDDSAL